MTNQAAQTMPALPRPYWKAGEVKDDYGNPYNETDLFTDDDMRAMYQQGYAAAISQTAGVPRDWTPLDIQTFARAYKAEVPGAVLTVHGIDAGLHALAAAPAASGGEDYSACCDTPAYCSSVRRCTAKDSPQPPAAASVSERARVASVLGPAETLMKMQPNDGERGNSSDLTETCEDSAKPTKAEQALTQQRGVGKLDG